MSNCDSTVEGFEPTVATVAFVDLAGFSAITDVYGDASAIAVLGRCEELVRQALGALGPPIRWIGDEAMFGFPDRATALPVLGRLIPACRSEPRIPLTRTGLTTAPFSAERMTPSARQSTSQRASPLLRSPGNSWRPRRSPSSPKNQESSCKTWGR